MLTGRSRKRYGCRPELKPIRRPVNGDRLHPSAELRTLLDRAFKTERGRHRSDEEAAA